MASLKLVNVQGAVTGTVEASDKVFAVEANPAVVYQAVVALQANQRHGTHKVKTRKEVSGGGKKPFKQKGTGHARQGTIRAPHMRHGGTVHGPVPRSYRQDIPTKMRRLALCCALSERVRNDRLCVLQGLSVAAPKTKPIAEMVAKVAPEGRKTLLVAAAPDQNLLLSARNLPRFTVKSAADVNVMDVLGAVRVVVQEEALAQLQERLS